jgi:hypothetical protein
MGNIAVDRRTPLSALRMLAVLVLTVTALVVMRPAPASAADFCTGSGTIWLRERGGAHQIPVWQRTCVIRDLDPNGHSYARSARIILYGWSGTRIKATLSIVLHDCATGAGMKGISGTWQAAGSVLQVTTPQPPDRSGRTAYAQGYNSSIYVTYGGKAYTGGGFFQSTYSSPGCR